jgi:hypothetical protein
VELLEDVRKVELVHENHDNNWRSIHRERNA